MPRVTTSLTPTSIEARRDLDIGIIGSGRLGTALSSALVAAGYTRIHPASRATGSIDAIVEACALVLLAVPDRAIGSLAETLAWRAGQGIVHCSGALGLDVLVAATAQGATAGCLHPLQTFPSASTPAADAARFRGITCGVEGASPLGDLLEGIASDLGARSVRLEGVDRARYHAAAVLVSNDVAALMAAGTRAWTQAGLPEDAARESLAPLLLSAASNVARLPLAEALTGPVARGDTGTVARHLAALAGDPDLSAVYRALGRELLRLDLGHSVEVREALAVLFRDR